MGLNGGHPPLSSDDIFAGAVAAPVTSQLSRPLSLSSETTATVRTEVDSLPVPDETPPRHPRLPPRPGRAGSWS